MPGRRCSCTTARVRLYADRFVVETGDVVDVATGDIVRLTVERRPTRRFAQTRVAACDQLATLRHPLLAPLVDYGEAEGCWFEARAALPALRGTRVQIQRTALHVVRFLRAAGVEPTAAGDSIRPAIERGAGRWRPVGHRLSLQPRLEPLLALLQQGGRPGVTRVTVCGAPGSGLRTVRLSLARAARLAGFIPIDGRLANGRASIDTSRHYCVLDWLPDGEELPWLLAEAADGGRRHVWFRFVRRPDGADAIRLQRFTAGELADMVYEDIELGPARTETARAAAAAAGLPGRFIDLLARHGRGGVSLSVHETAATYLCAVGPHPPSDTALDLLARAKARLDRMRLPEAESACRTLLAGEAPADVKDEARVVLATALWVAADHAALDVVLDEAFVGRSAAGALVAAQRAITAGDVKRGAALARLALNRSAPDEHPLRCRAHLALMEVAAATSDPTSAAWHRHAARFGARRAQRTDLRLLVTAGRIARLPAAARQRRSARILAWAAAVSPLCEHEVRAALEAPADESRRDAVAVLERLLALVFEAPTEAEAVARVAEFLLHELKACTVTVRGARAQSLALAGRPWPGDDAVADVVLAGGASLLREEVMPHAAEPIRVGGATVGCIAARWLPGAGYRGAGGTLRVAAAAVASVVGPLNTPPPEITGSVAPDDLLGRGAAADRIRELIRRAAGAPYPVLIQGESGSGKELVARAIHARSGRRARRFCAVNCAAFADDLLEAELFGHARGAFTGAVGERAGLFEEADQGTLFLDEVSELSARAQAKLLRVLQEGELRRVGETAVRKIDVRVLAATNRCLEAEVDAGRFRADLRFRLDVLRIDVPPLRDRTDDVPCLAERIWAEAMARVGTRASLAPDFLAALARYDWPGNVRELQNVLAAVAVHAPRRGCVHAASLPPHVARLASRSAVTFEAARLDFEQRFVRAALARAGGRPAVAARQLGVSRQGLAKMLKRLGLRPNP